MHLRKCPTQEVNFNQSAQVQEVHFNLRSLRQCLMLQRSVMEDPMCMPSNMHPYILAMTGFGHPYNRHNTQSVPAE